MNSFKYYSSGRGEDRSELSILEVPSFFSPSHYPNHELAQSITMAPTILIVGATGNTGRSVVSTLSSLIGNSSPSNPLHNHQILALTRSSKSSAAQQLAALPSVKVLQKVWVDIDPSFLQERSIVRAFIASHNEPTQFAEESKFHLALLHAGVDFVVRISTTAANVRPDYKAYYPRQHWAVEALLSSPEFAQGGSASKGLKWTSLQPNVFTQFVLGPAVAFVKEFRKTEKLPQGPLRLMASEDARVGIVDPDDVGILAAHLLASENPDVHNGKKYVVNGPEDITGKQIVEMVEQEIGKKIEVLYKDRSSVEAMAEGVPLQQRSLILSIKHAPETAWEGKCGTETTSKEVLEIAAPTRTPGALFKTMLEE